MMASRQDRAHSNFDDENGIELDQEGIDAQQRRRLSTPEVDLPGGRGLTSLSSSLDDVQTTSGRTLKMMIGLVVGITVMLVILLILVAVTYNGVDRNSSQNDDLQSSADRLASLVQDSDNAGGKVTQAGGTLQSLGFLLKSANEAVNEEIDTIATSMASLQADNSDIDSLAAQMLAAAQTITGWQTPTWEANTPFMVEMDLMTTCTEEVAADSTGSSNACTAWEVQEAADAVCPTDTGVITLQPATQIVQLPAVSTRPWHEVIMDMYKGPMGKTVSMVMGDYESTSNDGTFSSGVFSTSMARLTNGHCELGSTDLTCTAEFWSKCYRNIEVVTTFLLAQTPDHDHTNIVGNSEYISVIPGSSVVKMTTHNTVGDQIGGTTRRRRYTTTPTPPPTIMPAPNTRRRRFPYLPTTAPTAAP